MTSINQLDLIIHSAIPTVYEKGLSYYEVLNTILQKVNELVASTNEFMQQDLREYVEDTLNGWLLDGTLSTLIGETMLISDAGNNFDTGNLVGQLQEIGTFINGSKAVNNLGVDDYAPIINSKVANLTNGGEIILAGTIPIKTPIVISKPGIYIRAKSPYKTRIVADVTFVGSELILFEQSEYSVNKSCGIETGIYVDCNNVAANGITVVNAYDQVVFKNIDVRNCNDNYICYNFIQQNALQIGQTILIENCIGQHYGVSTTLPVFFFQKYQEMTLINCKALGHSESPSPNGIGFHLKNCRGVNLVGHSMAFLGTGVLIEAESRDVAGITLIGGTHEEIGTDGIKTIGSNGFIVKSLHVKGIRNQNGPGAVNLDNITNSHIDVENCSVTLGANTSNIFVICNDVTTVTDNGTKNTIMGLRNATENSVSFTQSIATRSPSSPNIELRVNNTTRKMQIQYSASDSLDIGVKFNWTSSAGVTQEIFGIRSAPASNDVGLLVYANKSGTKTLAQVKLGLADSGGTGYRQLLIDN